MRKEIYIPVLGIAAGEIMMFSGMVSAGLGIDIINLLGITLVVIFSSVSSETKNVLQSLLLLLLLRIISLAMPQLFAITFLRYPFIYVVMLLPIYSIIKNQQISSKELGINFGRLHIYLPAAILIGAMIAVIEYRTLNPVSPVQSFRFSNLILTAIALFVFIGAVEELIFRSILQTRLEGIFGLRYGLLLSSGIFGIMHAGNGTINEILFACIFGIILGYVFQKTRSLPLIVAIRGTAYVILFSILPIILVRA